MTTDLAKPTINLNGTSRDSLLHDYIKTLNYLNGALDCLYQTGPHGRDYPDPVVYMKARAQHEARCAALRQVRAELEEIGESIA